MTDQAIDGICASDGECPSNEICYSSATWVKDGGNGGIFDDPDISLINGNETLHNCLCNQYYGFVRSKSSGLCSDLSASSYIVLFFDFIYVIWSGVCFLFVLDDIVNLRSQRKYGLDMASTTLTFLLFGYGFMLTFCALDIDSVLSPLQSHPCDVTDPEGDKCLKNDTAYGVIYTLWISCCVLACFNVSLLWIEIYARAVKRSGGAPVSNINRYKYPLIILSALFFLGKLIIAILNAWDYDYVVTVPFLFCVIIVYYIGWRRMFVLYLKIKSTAGTSAQTHSKIKKNIENIKFTSVTIIIVGLIYIADVLWYSMMYQDGMINYTLYKKISVLMIVDYMEHIFGLTIATCVFRYVHKSAHLTDATGSRAESGNDLPGTFVKTSREKNVKSEVLSSGYAEDLAWRDTKKNGSKTGNQVMVGLELYKSTADPDDETNEKKLKSLQPETNLNRHASSATFTGIT